MNAILCSSASWGQRVFAIMERPDWRLVTKPKELAKAVADVNPEMIFFLHWGAHVPDDITTKYLCVNFHCTPLPYGRGGSPIENMIKSGHQVTVMTAHRMTAEVDAGPIYGQLGPIALYGTRQEILDGFVDPCVELLTWIARARPDAMPQTGDVTKFERLSDEEFKTFWAEREAALRPAAAEATEPPEAIE